MLNDKEPICSQKICFDDKASELGSEFLLVRRVSKNDVKTVTIELTQHLENIPLDNLDTTVLETKIAR